MPWSIVHFKNRSTAFVKIKADSWVCLAFVAALSIIRCLCELLRQKLVKKDFPVATGFAQGFHYNIRMTDFFGKCDKR